MRDETSLFLRYLLARSEAWRHTARLTITAMHPDREHRCPSQHVPLDDPSALSDTVDRLFEANERGWGGFLAVGLRIPQLGRWRRGGIADVTALTALFVDLDDPSVEALYRLRTFRPMPSCIVDSGGGYHAYWWLDEPTADLNSAASRLRSLSQRLGGDPLSLAHSLRLPGTINTKPERAGVRCHLLDLRDESYPLSLFEPAAETAQATTGTGSYPLQPTRILANPSLNPDLIATVANTFANQGYRQRGDWLNGPCIYPEHHRHGDRHCSFGYVESESLSRDQTLSATIGQAALPKSTREYLAYGAPVGQRNRALFAAACQFRDAGYPVPETESLLVPRYLADSQDHEWRQAREGEARRTIRSAYRRSPRQALGPVSQSRSGR